MMYCALWQAKNVNRGGRGGRCQVLHGPPMGTGRSEVARKHARLWAHEDMRIRIARRMYGYQFQTAFPNDDIAVLRGMEEAG